MRSWTWSEIKNKVEADLDLFDEDFVTPSEMLGYANAAIDEAEAEILTIYEDYLLASENITITAGTKEYDLPTTIHAHKIRIILYDDGQTKYPLKRIKKLSDLLDIESTDDYRYFITNNSTASGAKIRIEPAPRSSSTTTFTVFFIRDANRLVDDSDVMDLPEASGFVIQYIKDKCIDKEAGTQNGQTSPLLEKERKILVDRLTEIIPDEDNEMLADLTHYEMHN